VQLPRLDGHMIPASPPFAVFLLLLVSKLGANCQ
jgi:hypothetical protein